MSSSTAFVSSPVALSRNSFTPRKDDFAKRRPRRVATASRRMEPRASSGFKIPFFSREENVALPQNDSDNREERSKAIADAQQTYQWTRELIGDASMIKGLPDEERPHFGWVAGVTKQVLRVSANDAAVRANEIGDDVIEKVKEATASVTAKVAEMSGKLLADTLDTETSRSFANEMGKLFNGSSGRKISCFEKYKHDFIVIRPDIVAAEDQFLRDDIFGWYRVAGPSPMCITKLSGTTTAMFPDLTDSILRGIPGFEQDTFAEMEKENRLYYVDYKGYDGVEAGTLPDGTKKEGYYLYAPKCLLAVPKTPDERTTVLPIAIHCGQDSSFPMYTPNPEHTDSVTWIAAKITVQVADSNRHATEFHLGRTHLLTELFVCATYRTLAPTHPIYKLLSTHFYGTAYINQGAVDLLIKPGGIIDNLTAQQIELTKDLAAKSVNSPSFSFNEWMPDRELANRGVLDAKTLKFPYRDDAMKLWEAINEWVDAYVRAYYKSDADVLNDSELTNWCWEVVGPNSGNLHGFGETADGQIQTVAYLVRAISMIIFTASAQHAAVNFPQSTMMQFVPSMPFAGFAPPPKTPKPFETMDQLVEEMLPTIALSQQQMNTAESIGVLRYTKLGDYGDSLEFAPDEVGDALEVFQKKLSVIGAEIQKRNRIERRAELPVYDHLVPSKIPQSVNI